MEEILTKLNYLFKRNKDIKVKKGMEGAIDISIDSKLIKEEVDSWINELVKKVKNTCPELKHRSDYLEEVVTVSFRKIDKRIKEELTHEATILLLEEDGDKTYLSVDFPLLDDGFDVYMKYYNEDKDKKVFMEYIFALEKEKKDMVIQGCWMKPIDEDYKEFEEKMKRVLFTYRDKLQKEFEKIPNWEKLTHDDEVYQDFEEQYCFYEDKYILECEEKLLEIIR